MLVKPGENDGGLSRAVLRRGAHLTAPGASCRSAVSALRRLLVPGAARGDYARTRGITLARAASPLTICSSFAAQAFNAARFSRS